MEPTSPTQMESHAVVQQYGSWAQIVPAQLVQDEVSFVPCEQMGCEQVPPPPPEVVVLPPPPQLLPQNEVTSLTHWPSQAVVQQ